MGALEHGGPRGRDQGGIEAAAEQHRSMAGLGYCLSRRGFFCLIPAIPACAEAPSAARQVSAAELHTMTEGAALAAAMVSRLRMANRRGAIATDEGLQRLAAEQALAMAQADQLSHEVQGSLAARLRGAGQAPGMAIENIAAGQETPAEAITAWSLSAGHRQNMLQPGLRRMGLAMAPAAHSAFGRYWALIMTD